MSIRKRALDLLYGMCDHDSAKAIVRQLLDYLLKAEYEVRQELATKTAMLAERFSSNKAWYMDVMLELLRTAGEDVPDDIWHRVIRVVLGCSEDVQAYAARTCFRALKDPQWNEILLKVAAYVLGEFGTLISEEMGSHPEAQFEALHTLWPTVSDTTRAVLLTTYAKFAFLYGADRNLVSRIQAVLVHYSASLDEELQQRASEYAALINLNPAIVEKVWDPMPAWDEDEMAPADMQDQQGRMEEQAMLSAATPGNGPAASLLGDFLHSQGPPAHASVLEPSPEDVAQHDQFYRQLWLAPEGFLYRDARLQIGVKSQAQAGVFHLMLYFGNSAGADIDNFSVTLPSVDYLQIAAKPVPPTIGAGQQASQLLSVGALKDFVPSPVLQLSFQCRGQAFHVPLTLPIILTKYVAGVTLDAAQFGAQWAQLQGGAGQEVVVVLKCSAQTVQTAFFNSVLQRYGFTPLPHVDPNPNNATAAGAFLTATGQSTPILIRVEGNAGALAARLTVRSPTPSVAQTVSKFIAAQLQVA